MIGLRNLIATFLLLTLDFAWLGGFMGARYKVLVKDIQKSELKVNYLYAISAYALMVYALNAFVIKYDFSGFEAIMFGVCLYGVYDFTAGAVFKNWNLPLALYDITWGGVVYFLAATVSKIIAKMFKK